MSDLNPITVEGVPSPTGAYSRAVVSGGFVFVSGQVPRDLATGELQGDDIRTQTHAVLDNVRQVLEAAGTSLDRVVSATVYLADISDWAAFDAAYREVFQPPYPTRTTVGAGLVGVRIEVSVIARAGR